MASINTGFDAFKHDSSKESSTPISYRANVNRAKTKKWTEAKPVDYGGDDWGDDDDYDNEGYPPEPEEPAQPTGFRKPGQGLAQRQRNASLSSYQKQYGELAGASGAGALRARSNSFGPDDESRHFSSGTVQHEPTPPPALSSPHPATRFSQMGVNTVPRKPSAGPPLSVTTHTDPPTATSKDPQLEPQAPGRASTSESIPIPSSASTASDIHARRDYSPSAEPQPLNTGASNSSFPGKKSSLSQVHSPVNAQSPKAWMLSDGAASPTQSTDKALPFIRPADIYRRVQEERQERERQSVDSGRPSMDSTGRPRGGSQSPVLERLHLDDTKKRKESLPGNEISKPAGHETLEQQSETSVLRSTEPIANLEPKTPSSSTSPKLPDLSRISGFGMESFFGQQQPEITDSSASSQSPLNANESDLHSQPSLGFRSVVNQAFDRVEQTDASLPPTPASSGSVVGRMDSASSGTTGISPIMSRVPSTGAAESRQREGFQPGIPEMPEPISPKGLGNIKQLDSAPEPIPPSFKPGHRRDLSTPSPGNSPARTPDLSAHQGVAFGHEGVLANTATVDTSQAPRPAVDRDMSFRPNLPGGWTSYATNATASTIGPGQAQDPTATSPLNRSESYSEEATTPTAAKVPLPVAESPEDGLGLTAEKLPSPANNPTLLSASTEARWRPDVLAPSELAGSDPPSVPAKDTPRAVDDQAGYFPQIAETTPRIALPGAQIGQTDDRDDINNRLEDDIVKRLSPSRSSINDGAGLDEQDQARQSTYSFPSEYDNYWATGGEAEPLSRPGTKEGATLAPFDADVAEVRPLTPRGPTDADRPALPHKFSWEQSSEIVSVGPVPDIMPAHSEVPSQPRNDEGEAVAPEIKEWYDESLAGTPAKERPGSVASVLTASDGLTGAAAATFMLHEAHRDPDARHSQISLAEEKEMLSPLPREEIHPAMSSFFGPANSDEVHDLESSLTGPAQPTSPLDNSKIMPFKDIVAVHDRPRRIQLFNETRERFASMDTGLNHWMGALQSLHPEHADIDESWGRGTSNARMSIHGPISSVRNKFSRSSGGGSGGGSLPAPYYTQYMNASSPTTSSYPTGQFGPSAAGPQQGASSGAGKLSSQQVQAKGKEFLHSAGIFGGKAGKAGKGLLAKGKNRLRSSGNGDKSPPSTTRDARRSSWMPARFANSFGARRSLSLDSAAPMAIPSSCKVCSEEKSDREMQMLCSPVSLPSSLCAGCCGETGKGEVGQCISGLGRETGVIYSSVSLPSTPAGFHVELGCEVGKRSITGSIREVIESEGEAKLQIAPILAQPENLPEGASLGERRWKSPFVDEQAYKSLSGAQGERGDGRCNKGEIAREPHIDEVPGTKSIAGEFVSLKQQSKPKLTPNQKQRRKHPSAPAPLNTGVKQTFYLAETPVEAKMPLEAHDWVMIPLPLRIFGGAKEAAKTAETPALSGGRANKSHVSPRTSDRKAIPAGDETGKSAKTGTEAPILPTLSRASSFGVDFVMDEFHTRFPISDDEDGDSDDYDGDDGSVSDLTTADHDQASDFLVEAGRSPRGQLPSQEHQEPEQQLRASAGLAKPEVSESMRSSEAWSPDEGEDLEQQMRSQVMTTAREDSLENGRRTTGAQGIAMDERGDAQGSQLPWEASVAPLQLKQAPTNAQRHPILFLPGTKTDTARGTAQVEPISQLAAARTKLKDGESQLSEIRDEALTPHSRQGLNKAKGKQIADSQRSHFDVPCNDNESMMAHFSGSRSSHSDAERPSFDDSRVVDSDMQYLHGLASIQPTVIPHPSTRTSDEHQTMTLTLPYRMERLDRMVRPTASTEVPPKRKRFQSIGSLFNRSQPPSPMAESQIGHTVAPEIKPQMSPELVTKSGHSFSQSAQSRTFLAKLTSGSDGAPTETHSRQPVSRLLHGLKYKRSNIGSKGEVLQPSPGAPAPQTYPNYQEESVVVHVSSPTSDIAPDHDPRWEPKYDSVPIPGGYSLVRGEGGMSVPTTYDPKGLSGPLLSPFDHSPTFYSNPSPVSPFHPSSIASTGLNYHLQVPSSEEVFDPHTNRTVFDTRRPSLDDLVARSPARAPEDQQRPYQLSLPGSEHSSDDDSFYLEDDEVYSAREAASVYRPQGSHSPALNQRLRNSSSHPGFSESSFFDGRPLQNSSSLSSFPQSQSYSSPCASFSPPAVVYHPAQSPTMAMYQANPHPFPLSGSSESSSFHLLPVQPMDLSRMASISQKQRLIKQEQARLALLRGDPSHPLHHVASQLTPRQQASAMGMSRHSPIEDRESIYDPPSPPPKYADVGINEESPFGDAVLRETMLERPPVARGSGVSAAAWGDEKTGLHDEESESEPEDYSEEEDMGDLEDEDTIPVDYPPAPSTRFQASTARYSSASSSERQPHSQTYTFSGPSYSSHPSAQTYRTDSYEDLYDASPTRASHPHSLARRMQLDQQEKIAYNTAEKIPLSAYGGGEMGPVREEEEEQAVMQASSYPGMEWNPLGGGGVEGWVDDGEILRGNE